MIIKFNSKLHLKSKEEAKKNTAIVQIITAPEGGGAEFIARKLTKELNQKGFNSFILYFSNPRNIKLYKWEFVLKTNSSRSFKNIFYLKKKIDIIKKNYKKIIIHTHLTWPFFYISFLKNRNSIVKIHTEHNTFNKRRLFPLFRYLENFLYKRFDYIIFISKSTKKNLENWIGEPIPQHKGKVIYNGSRSFKISLNKPNQKGKIRIISIGSLTYQKGFDIAIKAISLCKDKVEKYSIYGDGPEKSKLQKLIKKLNLENKVILKGYEPNIDKVNLNYDLALIPSRWEGFGLVAIEFLSAGIPVIASSIEGLKEILKECNAATLITEINECNFAEEIKKQNLINFSIKKLIKY